MTKKELLERIDAFVASMPDNLDNEWYCTPRELVGDTMEEFKDFLKATEKQGGQHD